MSRAELRREQREKKKDNIYLDSKGVGTVRTKNQKGRTTERETNHSGTDKRVSRTNPNHDVSYPNKCIGSRLLAEISKEAYTKVC